jgi:hypothetical protein
LEANLEVLKGFEAHYPEMMKMAIAVNCKDTFRNTHNDEAPCLRLSSNVISCVILFLGPKVFSVLYSVIKPLMSSRTQAKLHIHDYNAKKWRKDLSSFIALDQLPMKYRVDRYKEIDSITNEDNGSNGSSDSSGDQSSVEIQR